MKLSAETLLVYAVTDRTWLGNSTLLEAVEQALQGGATLVQLREKNASFTDFLATAIEMQALCARYNVPLLINDNVEIALACGAAGVHVGQSDMTAGDVRARLGADKIIGVTARTVEQALLAEQAGADYLGVGAVFGTSTKHDARPLDPAILRDICHAVRIPVCAIGGIIADNITQLKGCDMDGFAVVSGIFAQPNIASATAKLRQLALETRRNPTV